MRLGYNQRAHHSLLALIIAVAGIVLSNALASAGPQKKRHFEVSLLVSPCLSLRESLLRRVFRIELATSMPRATVVEAMRPARPTRAPLSTIELSCRGRSAEIRIDNRITGKTRSRRIDIASLSPESRERLLALAAMELLIASNLDLRKNAPPLDSLAKVNSAVTHPPNLEHREKEHLQVAPWSDIAVLTVEMSMQSQGLQPSAGLRWIRDHKNGLGWSASALYNHAATEVRQGRVDTKAAYFSLAAHARANWHSAGSRISAGLRIGAVSMSGTAAQASTEASEIFGVVVSPLLRLDLSRSIGSIILMAFAESGYHLRGIGALADNVRVTSVSDGWLSLALGVGKRW